MSSKVVSNILLCLWIFAIIVNAEKDITSKGRSCPENEESSECGANGCQNTCAHPTFSWICRGICTAGCVCKEGFLRNDKGRCVHKENCGARSICPENEELSECGANGCQNTCAHPTFSQICRGMCTAGCVCREGYLRNDKGTCVLKENCDAKQCGKNEVWNPCEEYCTFDEICQSLAIDCVVAPDDWKCKGRCECAEGFVRIDGSCEDRSKCLTVITKEPLLESDEE